VENQFILDREFLARCARSCTRIIVESVHNGVQCVCTGFVAAVSPSHVIVEHGARSTLVRIEHVISIKALPTYNRKHRHESDGGEVL